MKNFKKRSIIALSIIALYLSSCSMFEPNLDALTEEQGASFTDKDGNTVTISFKGPVCKEGQSMDSSRYRAVFNPGWSPDYVGVFDSQEKLIRIDNNKDPSRNPTFADGGILMESMDLFVSSKGTNDINQIRYADGNLYQDFQKDPQMYIDSPIMGSPFMCKMKYIVTVTSPNGSVISGGGSLDDEFVVKTDILADFDSCPTRFPEAEKGRYHKVYTATSFFGGNISDSADFDFGPEFNAETLRATKPFMKYVGVYDTTRRKVYKDKRNIVHVNNAISFVMDGEVVLEAGNKYIIEARGFNDVKNLSSSIDIGAGMSVVPFGENKGQLNDGLCVFENYSDTVYTLSEEEKLVQAEILDAVKMGGANIENGRYAAAFQKNGIGTYDYIGAYDLQTGLFYADDADETVFNNFSLSSSFIPFLGTDLKIGYTLEGAMQVDQQTDDITKVKQYFGFVPSAVATTAFNNYIDVTVKGNGVAPKEDGYYINGRRVTGIITHQKANIETDACLVRTPGVCWDHEEVWLEKQTPAKQLEYLFLVRNDMNALKTVLRRDLGIIGTPTALKYGAGSGVLPYTEASLDVIELIYSNGQHVVVDGLDELDRMVRVVNGEVTPKQQVIYNPQPREVGYYLDGELIVGTTVTNDQMGFGYDNGRKPTRGTSDWYDWLDQEKGVIANWTNEERLNALAYFGDHSNGNQFNGSRSELEKLVPNRFRPSNWQYEFVKPAGAYNIYFRSSGAIELYADGDIGQGWNQYSGYLITPDERADDYTNNEDRDNNVADKEFGINFQLGDGRKVNGSLTVFRDIVYYDGTNLKANKVDR